MIGFRPAERGVTLPEVLVALAILLVVSVAVLSLFAYAMRLNSTSRHYTSLTRCVRDSAEHLLALPWSDPRLSPGVHEGGADADGNSRVWRVRDERVDGSSSLPLSSTAFGEANLKEISVTCIGGREAGIGRRDVTVVVLKARR